MGISIIPIDLLLVGYYNSSFRCFFVLLPRHVQSKQVLWILDFNLLINIIFLFCFFQNYEKLLITFGIPSDPKRKSINSWANLSSFADATVSMASDKAASLSSISCVAFNNCFKAYNESNKN